MNTITASKARQSFYSLVDRSADQPLLITGKRQNAVLISQDDWNAIQETLYLLSIPGMRKSIRQGLRTPVASCSKELPW